MTRQSDCSIFVDETGGEGGQSHYYAVTLVFHDQADDLSPMLDRYESALRSRGLVDLPFHASPAQHRLSQAADMICTLELAAQKYRSHEATATDEKFFGSAGSFKNNYMKSLKRKRL